MGFNSGFKGLILVTVQLHIPAKLPHEKNFDTHRIRGSVATGDAIQALEEKNLLSLPRIEPTFLDLQALSLVTIRILILIIKPKRCTNISNLFLE